MELETLIAIPALTFMGALLYLLSVNTKGSRLGAVRRKLTPSRYQDSNIEHHDLLKVLYAGTVIFVIMILTPWVIFYVRSGARLSFITDYLLVLFVLSLCNFPFIYYFIRKKNEGRG